MPKADVNPEAILEAVKKIDIVSELLDEKNKNNLKMIAEGKVSGGKQIGPYARLLNYAPGETIVREGEWGGNTFYLSVDGELRVWPRHREIEPGAAPTPASPSAPCPAARGRRAAASAPWWPRRRRLACRW